MIRNILVRAPNWVGDVVMATSNFADIRRSFPGARITVLVRSGRERILDGSPDYDEILIDRAGHSPRKLLSLARELRAANFDLAIIFPRSFQTALVPFLARIPRRVGYRGSLRDFLLTDALSREYDGPKPRPVPMPLYYGKLCEKAGVERGDGKPRLYVTSECEKEAAEYRRALGIGDREPLVGLNPGAAFGASKLWPPRYFSELGDAISERYRMRTLLLVGPGEESLADEIVSGMQHRPVYDRSRIFPLDVLKPVIRDLKLLVTTDTGPRQYAVAFGVPALVVMGPTHPGFTAINLEQTEVVRHDVPCGPCHLKVCPLDHKCMVGIRPEEMMERLGELDRRVGVFQVVNRE